MSVTLEQLFGNKLTKSNYREGTNSGPRGQNYTGIVFSTNKKGKQLFKFANQKWEDLGLDSRGFCVSPMDGNVFMILVDDTAEGRLKPTILKSGKSDNKVKSFKNDVLRDELVKVNLLKNHNEKDVAEGNPLKQYLELEKVDFPESDGIYGVFKIVAAEASEGDDDEDDSFDDSEDEVVEEEDNTSTSILDEL